MKRTNIYNLAIAAFIAILLGTGTYFIYKKYDTGDLATYTSNVYGVSFTYPENYSLIETPTDDGAVVVITEKRIQLPENGEGPTAITVAMYDTPTGAATSTLSLTSWIETSPHSNFNLSKMDAPGAMQIAGQNAFLYTWDGLYQGTTIATRHASATILFSVTYDGETDMEKREAFTDLVASVQFFEPGSDAALETGTAGE